MTTQNAQASGSANQYDDLLLDADAEDRVNQANDAQQRRRRERAPDPEPEDDLPTPYRGKSAAELARMLEAKEQMIGRQSTEIGHLRDLTQQVLDAQAARAASTSKSQSEEPEVQVTSDEILDRPVDAIRKVVKPLLDSAVNEVKNAVSGVQRNTAAEKFAAKYPTYEQDMQNPEFQEFVRSSRYRSRLAATAREYSDFEAADELWDAWQEHQKGADASGEDEGQENNQQQRQRQQQLNAARTVRSGSRDTGRAAGKPVFSAVKLQQMRNERPDEYYSPTFQQMILDAYRDNRVR